MEKILILVLLVACRVCMSDAGGLLGAIFSPVARVAAGTADDVTRVASGVARGVDDVGRAAGAVDDVARTAGAVDDVALQVGKNGLVKTALVGTQMAKGATVAEWLLFVAQKTPNVPTEIFTLLDDVGEIVMDNTLKVITQQGLIRMMKAGGATPAADPLFWEQVIIHLKNVKALQITDETVRTAVAGLKELEPSQLMQVQRLADDAILQVSRARNALSVGGSSATNFYVRRSAGDIVKSAKNQIRQKMKKHLTKELKERAYVMDKMSGDNQLGKLMEMQAAMKEAGKNLDNVVATVVQNADAPLSELSTTLGTFLERASDVASTVSKIAQSQPVAKQLGGLSFDQVLNAHRAAGTRARNVAVGVGAGVATAGVSGGIGAAASAGGGTAAATGTATATGATAGAAGVSLIGVTGNTVVAEVAEESQRRGGSSSSDINNNRTSDDDDRNKDMGYLWDGFFLYDDVANLVEDDDDLDGDYGFVRKWGADTLEEDQIRWEEHLRLEEEVQLLYTNKNFKIHQLLSI